MSCYFEHINLQLLFKLKVCVLSLFPSRLNSVYLMSSFLYEVAADHYHHHLIATFTFRHKLYKMSLYMDVQK